MKLNKAALILLSALMIFASACGADAKTPPPLSVNDAASTLVALTFEAATQIASLNTPTPLPSPIPTPAVAKPIAYFPVEARCRTAPNPNFKVVGTFPVGSTVELIGKDASQTAWLVKVPNSGETCWVLAQDASPGGDIQSLPVVTPQPGSSASAPMPVVSISYDFYCTYTTNINLSVTTKLDWFVLDKTANGYRVYRSDIMIADVPADTITYTDTTSIVVGTRLFYSVEAYNDAGVSARKTINFICK